MAALHTIALYGPLYLALLDIFVLSMSLQPRPSW